jgi:CHAD domain-containing protein
MPAMAVPVSLSQVVHQRLDAFTKRADLIHDADVEALHHTRVASRRLREVVPLLGLKADTARKINRRLRRVTRQLGTVRELDVMALLVQDLSRDTQYSPAALKRVAGAVIEERDAARKRLAAKLPLSKLRRLADRIDQAATGRPTEAGRSHQSRREPQPRQGWLWAVDARAARRAGTLEDAIDTAGALYDPVRLHDVRVALKKLRYATELSADARQRRERADLSALKDAQDLLGRIHDLEMLVTLTRRLQISQSPPDLMTSRDLEPLLSALARECRALHARYMHDRTKILQIADRMRHAISRPSLRRRRIA